MGKLVSGPPAVLILLLFGLTTACSEQQARSTDGRMADPFFDLRGYIEEEIERLDRLQPPVLKKVRIDERVETKNLDSLHYADELQVFLNADINRPAWWDQYRIDSVQTNGALQAVRYEAANPQLQVRRLQIEWQDGKVSRVFAIRQSKSPTANLYYEMDFQPQSGYQVVTRQDIALSKPREMSIEVQFRN